jgi:hypothetical protein
MDCVWGPVNKVYYSNISNFSGWYCCDVGCFMWLFIRNKLLRLSVKMWIFVWVVRMVLIAMCIALSSTLKIFW